MFDLKVEIEKIVVTAKNRCIGPQWRFDYRVGVYEVDLETLEPLDPAVTKLLNEATDELFDIVVHQSAVDELTQILTEQVLKKSQGEK